MEFIQSHEGYFSMKIQLRFAICVWYSNGKQFKLSAVCSVAVHCRRLALFCIHVACTGSLQMRFIYSVLSVSFEVAGWVKDVGGWVNEHRRCEPLGGSGGMPPQKILKSRRSEMAFPAFSNTYFPLKWQCKKCNTGAKSVTPVQITHRNSGLID